MVARYDVSVKRNDVVDLIINNFLENNLSHLLFCKLPKSDPFVIKGFRIKLSEIFVFSVYSRGKYRYSDVQLLNIFLNIIGINLNYYWSNRLRSTHLSFFKYHSLTLD